VEIEKLEAIAWFIHNSDDRPQPVGTLNANPFGLHDMFGNVWECGTAVGHPWPTDRLFNGSKVRVRRIEKQPVGANCPSVTAQDLIADQIR